MESKEKSQIIPEGLESFENQSGQPEILSTPEEYADNPELDSIRGSLEKSALEQKLQASEDKIIPGMSGEALAELGLSPETLEHVPVEDRSTAILNAIMNTDLKKDSPDAGTKARELQDFANNGGQPK